MLKFSKNSKKREFFSLFSNSGYFTQFSSKLKSDTFNTLFEPLSWNWAHNIPSEVLASLRNSRFKNSLQLVTPHWVHLGALYADHVIHWLVATVLVRVFSILCCNANSTPLDICHYHKQRHLTKIQVMVQQQQRWQFMQTVQLWDGSFSSNQRQYTVCSTGTSSDEQQCVCAQCCVCRFDQNAILSNKT